MTCEPGKLYVVDYPSPKHPTAQVIVTAGCTCDNPDHYYTWVAECVAMPATSALARKGYTI